MRGTWITIRVLIFFSLPHLSHETGFFLDIVAGWLRVLTNITYFLCRAGGERTSLLRPVRPRVLFVNYARTSHIPGGLFALRRKVGTAKDECEH
jgi:hypothetical protein